MKLVRTLILFIALSLALPAARAESLFSLLATPAPAPAATPAPALHRETPIYEGGLFAQLATPAPAFPLLPSPEETAAPSSAPTAAPAADGASALFNGLGYGDLTGKQARAVENKSEGTMEYLYDGVAAEDYQRYEAFLRGKDCIFQAMQTNPATAVCNVVYQSATDFGFMMIYETDKQILTLVYFPDTMDSEETAGQSTAEAETHTEEKTANVCPWCNQGRCAACHGRGAVKCTACAGLGVCGICHGKRTHYSPGYGGVGTGSYYDCTACGGSGRCYACGGAGRVQCGACDGGVCSACQGDYRNYR